MAMLNWDERAHTKASWERQIMGLFADYASIHIDKATIESREPPAPDIICHVEGHGLVAFELVRLLDPMFGRGHSLLMQTREALQKFFATLEGDIGQSLRGKYADARVTFLFNDRASPASRESCLPQVADLLAALPQEGEGSFDIKGDLADILIRVTIERPRPGPWFEMEYSARPQDPTLATLYDKLVNKGYKVPHRVELVAYAWNQLLPPRESWLAPVRALLEDKLAASPFKRVWVVAPAECTIGDPIRLCYP